MVVKDVKDFIEKSVDNTAIKKHIHYYVDDDEIKEYCLDSMLNYDYMVKVFDEILSRDKYLNELNKDTKKYYNIVPKLAEKKYIGETLPVPYSFDGNNPKEIKFSTKETYRDFIAYAHLKGSMMYNLISRASAKSHFRETDLDEKYLARVMPIFIETMVLSELKDSNMMKYMNTLRAKRAINFSIIDTALRTEIDHFDIDSLRKVVKSHPEVQGKYFDAFFREIEMGHDPVLDSFIDLTAQGYAERMYSNKHYKKDIDKLIFTPNITQFDYELDGFKFKK